jgi:hypothetical protein
MKPVSRRVNGLIDPMLALSISMHANPGVYALLIGSGVSRAAGIPTGWEVVQDLIRKVAAARGVPCEPTPDEWFEAVYSAKPDYSDLLEDLAKTPAERRELLRHYFEPSEAERRQGIKTPTAAHRAIAKLVRDGYVRVVLTTNFDRLLESAIHDVGIQPAVIHGPDAVAGAQPLVHSVCTVIKVHGDYLDTRIKNTRGELASYDPIVDRILDQVFDEYGIIVCGWSADWDAALRDALTRSPARRFATYWTVRSPAKNLTADLIDFRRADVIQIDSANAFFEELAGKVGALTAIAQPHPLSAAVAVEQLKEYLRDDRADIRLHDLVLRETEAAVAAVWSTSFSASTPYTRAEFTSRLHRYEAATGVLMNLVMAGAYWGTNRQEGLWVKAFRSIATWRDSDSGNIASWLDLKIYPALLLLYSLGIGYVASDQYGSLDRLLRLELAYRFDHRKRSVARAIHSNHVMGNLAPDSLQRWLPGGQTQYTPLSLYLSELLREQARAYLPDDAEYTECFDWFEYLLALTCFDITTAREERPSAPVGCFAWRRGNDVPTIYEQSRIVDGKPLPPRVYKILDSGLFGAEGRRLTRRFSELKTAFDSYAQERSAHMT